MLGPVLETGILGAPRINPINMLGIRVMSTREKSNAGRGEGNISDMGQDEGRNGESSCSLPSGKEVTQ